MAQGVYPLFHRIGLRFRASFSFGGPFASHGPIDSCVWRIIGLQPTSVLSFYRGLASVFLPLAAPLAFVSLRDVVENLVARLHGHSVLIPCAILSCNVASTQSSSFCGRSQSRMNAFPLPDGHRDFCLPTRTRLRAHACLYCRIPFDLLFTRLSFC